MPEAKKQVALADRIVLTKGDLADGAMTRHLIERLGALTAAPVGIAVDGEIDPSFLLAEPLAPRDSFDLGASEHTHGLCSFALVFEEAMPWAGFQQAMAVLTGLRGPDLLRVKGLVAIEECRGPVVVHVVQHVVHAPVELEDWPDGDRRSRLVFVTRDLGRDAVAQLFTNVAAIAPRSPA
jgi:G3E family GTPase